MSLRYDLRQILELEGPATIDDLMQKPVVRHYNKGYVYSLLAKMRKKGLIDHRARTDKSRCYEYFVNTPGITRPNTDVLPRFEEVQGTDKPMTTTDVDDIQLLFTQLQDAFNKLQAKLNQKPNLASVSNNELIAELQSRML